MMCPMLSWFENVHKFFTKKAGLWYEHMIKYQYKKQQENGYVYLENLTVGTAHRRAIEVVYINQVIGMINQKSSPGHNGCIGRGYIKAAAQRVTKGCLGSANRGEIVSNAV